MYANHAYNFKLSSIFWFVCMMVVVFCLAFDYHFSCHFCTYFCLKLQRYVMQTYPLTNEHTTINNQINEKWTQANETKIRKCDKKNSPPSTFPCDPSTFFLRSALLFNGSLFQFFVCKFLFFSEYAQHKYTWRMFVCGESQRGE